jgi:hypothetical protein
MSRSIEGKVSMVHELWIAGDHPHFEKIDPASTYTFEEVGTTFKTTWSGCRPVDRDGVWVFDLRAPDVITSIEPTGK